jgi:hypothetical protein
MTCHLICNKSNTTCATGEVGTANQGPKQDSQILLNNDNIHPRALLNIFYLYRYKVYRSDSVWDMTDILLHIIGSILCFDS